MEVELEIGSTFGEFTLLEMLARGPVSAVYRADHPSLGRDIAVKIVDVADEPCLEAATRASAIGHPGIVATYGRGRVGGNAWLAMRLITGVDLRTWLTHTRLSLPEVSSLVRQVAAALDALRSNGLAHGDVKPHNVLVTTGGGNPDRLRTHLIDPLPPDSTNVTVDYAAPERLQGNPPDSSADQYALATIAYECLSGAVPYPGNTRQETVAAHLSSPPPTLRGSRTISDPLLATALDTVLRAALSRVASDRYASSSGFASAFDQAIAVATADRDGYGDAGHRDTFPVQRRDAPTITAPSVPQRWGTGSAPVEDIVETARRHTLQAVARLASPELGFDHGQLPVEQVASAVRGAVLRPEWASLTSAGPPPPTNDELLEVLRTSARAEVARSASSDEVIHDDVDCSVFAPSTMSPGSSALIQVFVHLPGQADVAAATATEFDERAERRGIHTLEVPIARDGRLTFELTIRGIDVPEPVQQLRWRGHPASVQFEAVVPPEVAIGQSTVGTLRVCCHGIPIGSLKFSIRVDSGAAGVVYAMAGNESKRFSRAFVSYSSKDRAAVLARLQVLRAAGIEYFQDIDLDPGQRWEQEIYRKIDGCDLFLLFWSQAAKESEWVRREVDYALQLGQRVPEIRPVVIEGPPAPPPWDELAHLHFDDRLLSLLAVASTV